MSGKINSELRSYFEMLPIDVENQILESDGEINTLDSLLSAVNTFLSQKDDGMQ